MTDVNTELIVCDLKNKNKRTIFDPHQEDSVFGGDINVALGLAL